MSLSLFNSYSVLQLLYLTWAVCKYLTTEARNFNELNQLIFTFHFVDTVNMYFDRIKHFSYIPIIFKQKSTQ